METATSLVYELEHKKIVITLTIDSLEFIKEHLDDKEVITKYIDSRINELKKEI